MRTKPLPSGTPDADACALAVCAVGLSLRKYAARAIALPSDLHADFWIVSYETAQAVISARWPKMPGEHVERFAEFMERRAYQLVNPRRTFATSWKDDQ